MGLKGTDSTLAKAGENEPIFALRAQDKLAPIAIRTWIGVARWFGVPQSKLDEAERCAVAMEEWNGARIPD